MNVGHRPFATYPPNLRQEPRHAPYGEKKRKRRVRTHKLIIKQLGTFHQSCNHNKKDEEFNINLRIFKNKLLPQTPKKN
jgi:hypothetical protein